MSKYLLCSNNLFILLFDLFYKYKFFNNWLLIIFFITYSAAYNYNC